MEQIPRVTILRHPHKSTSWAIYLGNELVCYRTKGRSPDVKKTVLAALVGSGRLPKRFELESYEAFSHNVTSVDASGTWPARALLSPAKSSAGGVRLWQETVAPGAFDYVLSDLSFPS
jgi:hypothetical protein